MELVRSTYIPAFAGGAAPRNDVVEGFEIEKKTTHNQQTPIGYLDSNYEFPYRPYGSLW